MLVKLRAAIRNLLLRRSVSESFERLYLEKDAFPKRNNIRAFKNTMAINLQIAVIGIYIFDGRKKKYFGVIQLENHAFSTIVSSDL